jgi:hypothetical protein
MPLVSHPLPMKRTVIIRSTKEGETTEKTETRDIEPGKYTLHFAVKDKISGLTLNKSIDFEVK